MIDLSEFDQKIRERLSLNETAKRAEQEKLQRSMSEFDRRHLHYTMVADRLMREVIKPCMERLPAYFDKAHEAEPLQGRHTCVYEFQRTVRFPGTATLEVSITRDSLVQTIQVCCEMKIVPVFTTIPEPDSLTMALHDVDEAKVLTWVEEKILGFVDTYLRLETTPSYQAENTTTDPVCGMTVNKATAPARWEHAGQTFYFCTEACRIRFVEQTTREVEPGGG